MKIRFNTLHIIAFFSIAVMLTGCGQKPEVMDGPATDTTVNQKLNNPIPGSSSVSPSDSLTSDTVRRDTSQAN